MAETGGGAAPPSALISSGGERVAEGDGEIGHQAWLVGLDGEQVIAAPVPDGPADGALAKRRIAGDDGALQRQALEQRQRRGDLTGLGRHPQLPDHRAQPGGEGGQQVHARAAVMAARGAAAQTLAVDRHMRPGAAPPSAHAPSTRSAAATSSALKK